MRYLSLFTLLLISCNLPYIGHSNNARFLSEKGYKISQNENEKKIFVSLYGKSAEKGDLVLLCKKYSVEALEFEKVTFEFDYFEQASYCDEVERIFFIDSTHADVNHFSLFTSLYLVGLGGPDYSDEDIKHLSQIKKLKWLLIGNSPITSRGVKYLAENAKKIEQLKLEDTNVDDTVFQYLLEMPKLREVSLRRTRVTDDAADRFVEEYRRRYNREVIVYT